MMRLLPLLALIFLFGCSPPKALLQTYYAHPLTSSQVPNNAYCVYPPLDYSAWFDYLNGIRTNTPAIVAKTYYGTHSIKDSVFVSIAQPSPFPHVVLDPALKTDELKLKGTWASAKAVVFSIKDSISFSDSSVHRADSFLTEIQDTALLRLDSTGFILYTRGAKESRFSKAAKKRYALLDGRYLLLYSNSPEDGNTSFIGIDSLGHLIMDNYRVVKRLKSHSPLPGYKLWKSNTPEDTFEAQISSDKAFGQSLRSEGSSYYTCETIVYRIVFQKLSD